MEKPLKKKVFQLGGMPLLVLLTPALAFAAPQTWSELVALFVLIINVATPTLVALALVLFLIRGLAAMTGTGGKEKGFSATRIREVALWGVGILFVMVSIWGILALLENTFLRGDTGFSSDSGGTRDCVALGGSGC